MIPLFIELLVCGAFVAWVIDDFFVSSSVPSHQLGWVSAQGSRKQGQKDLPFELSFFVRLPSIFSLALCSMELGLFLQL